MRDMTSNFIENSNISLTQDLRILNPTGDFSQENNNKVMLLKNMLRSIITVVFMSVVLLGGIIWYLSGVAITKINITGDIRISNEVLLKQMRIQFPITYFQVDIQTITQRLEEHPLIYRASVSKKISGKLLIALERSNPLVSVLSKIDGIQTPSYFDNNGRCVQVGVGLGIVDVPILSGITLVNPEIGVYLPEWLLELTNNLSNIRRENPELFRNISEIEIQDQGLDYRILMITFIGYDARFIIDININNTILLQLWKFANTVSSTESLLEFDYFDVRQGVIIGKRGDITNEK